MNTSTNPFEDFGFENLAEQELTRAACRGDADAIAKSVAGGANPNAKSPEVGTVLGSAIKCRSVTGVQSLLKAGADPNLSYRKGDMSPLMAASAFDDAEMIELLVKAGAEIDFVSDSGAMPTPLEVALVRGIETKNWTSYNKLLELGADINLVYNDGNTIAQSAAAFGQMDRVYDLLKSGYRYDLPGLEAGVRGRMGTKELEAEKARVLKLLEELRES